MNLVSKAVTQPIALPIAKALTKTEKNVRMTAKNWSMSNLSLLVASLYFSMALKEARQIVMVTMATANLTD